MKSFYVAFTILLYLTSGVLFGDNKELYLVESGQRMNGPDVERLQKYLLYNGVDIGPDGVDGWFGTDTDKALRQFQKSKKLPVTGRIVITDIPRELKFQTELKEWPADKAPPRKTAFSKRSVAEGVVKTRFGKITVKAESQYEEELMHLALSPDERFLTYTSFSPMIDMQVSEPLIVTDTLTGGYVTVNGLQILELREGNKFEKIFLETDYSRILDYYWISEKALYITAEVTPYKGKVILATGVLTVKQ
jgi:peptidoglycan hydrolase-like protein with peptidoglycan-binding domain